MVEAGKGIAPTEEGSPQGDMISPLLMNIALHGLEEAAGVRYRHTGAHAGEARADSPILTRYADDFVAGCHSKQQAEQIKAQLTEWLMPRGLTLNEEKTKIVHLADWTGSPGRRSSGTRQSKARHPPMTPRRPAAGPNGGDESNPHWMATRCDCSPGRTAIAPYAEIHC